MSDTIVQKRVSPFSAAMIGVHEEISNPARDIFIAEAKEVSEHMKSIHHARKISHMQVYYPETVGKLSRAQQEQVNIGKDPSRTSIPSATPREVAHQRKIYQLDAWQQSMKEHVKNEKFINTRKKEFNRETGRKAIAHQVMSGKAPMPNHVLFPHGATHEQILAMTGTLKAPDARNIPPAVPRLRKWKGDNVGWDE